MEKKEFLLSIEATSDIHIPRWNELPEFDLYMDQVIGLAEKHLSSLYIDKKAMLTPSMINNYVKSGVLPPPKNKKYNRTHLAILMIVCAMKPVMEISSISDIIGRSTASGDMENVLDEFARMYESEIRASIKKARLTVEASHHEEILSFIAIENTLKANAARIVAMHAYHAIKAERPSKEIEKKTTAKAKQPAKPQTAAQISKEDPDPMPNPSENETEI